MVWVTHGPAETCDPHYSYDTASGEIIFNVYENLVRWPYGIVDADEVDLSYSLDPADLLPMLATKWEVSEDGRTYIFWIREGVKFHEGGTLTPEDVEYSFERGMLQDRDGGPIWMLLEPLTGFSSLRDIAKKVLPTWRYEEIGGDLHQLTPLEQTFMYKLYIDPVVEVEDQTVVVFHLPKPYPPFITILAHGGSWGAILDKEWCIEVAGCWDGQPDTWANWWNPGGGEAAEESELYNIANGTGPFKLARWDVGVEVVFERFDDYWREPARLKYAIIKKTAEWSDRLLMFQAGDADICTVPRQNQAQVEGLPGIVSIHHLPTLSMNPVAFFVAPVVVEGNEFIGEGPWDGLGIPPDFFADINVRRAFCMAFDYDTYIQDVLLGEGYKTHGPIPQAFDWAYNPDPNLLWEYDLEQATELMRTARNGEIWEKGFNLTILYNEGNEPRRVAAEILEANIESMNPKFQVEVRAVPWNTYLSYLVTAKLPLFIIGWLADFPDPHNFAVPFVASYGTFSGWQGEYMVENIFRPYFDPLVEAGMATTDQAERAQAYYEISRLAHEYAIDIWLPQAEGLRNIRDWVQGYPFNPIFPGPYFY
ncbi:MAG TPA: ABC transporter substrate-binding protein, partial [Candidatus Acetothermia bacterium]|nr:ABC transporter substrate-binding protein [Candidatus Acetothermia bacterium]